MNANLRPDERAVLQHLIDALTALAPLIQRLYVTAHQQEADARRALECIERAVRLLEQRKPTLPSGAIEGGQQANRF